MAAAIYSTANMEGVDVNQIFILDTGTPEYPRAPFGLGTRAFGTDGSDWVYCTSSVTLAASTVVIISAAQGTWSCAAIGGLTVTTAPTGRLVGVIGGSQGSLVVPAPSGTQTGTFFWVQRAGNAPNVKCIASATVQTLLYSVATVAGAVSLAAGGSGTTYIVNGMVIVGATGSVAGPNAAVLNYPAIGLTG